MGSPLGARRAMKGPLGKSTPSGEVASNWWDPNDEGLCVWGAWQAKGAASYAASLQDLTGNGHTLTEGVGAVTWDAINGRQYSPIDGDYLRTTFVPASDQSQTMLLQFTNLGTAEYQCGVRSTDLFAIRDSLFSNKVTYYNSSEANGLQIVGTPASGNLCIAGNTAYRDGVPETGTIGAYSSVPILPVWLGALNNEGVPDMGDFYESAFVLYDCVLTPTQVLAVATAMAAL